MRRRPENPLAGRAPGKLFLARKDIRRDNAGNAFFRLHLQEGVALDTAREHGLSRL